MISMTETEHWLILREEVPSRETVIGTLGPAGTSSEMAARALYGKICRSAERAKHINLYGTYEDAAVALRRSEVSHVVVANAYAAINEFYMDNRISLAGAFVMDTPEYGLACRPGRAVSQRPKIATHPAPRPLLRQLFPSGSPDSEILQVTSTSAAAKAAYEEAADLALTTAPAAESYGLQFISPTRTIRMVWSIFVSSR
jgi:prephenate dehydratase